MSTAILLHVHVYRIHEFEHVIWIILVTDQEYSHEVYLLVVNIECDLLNNEIPFSMDLI